MPKAKSKKPLGETLRLWREHAGLTPKQVAELVGKDVHTVYRWEWSKRAPGLDDLQVLADAFGTSPGSIVDGVSP